MGPMCSRGLATGSTARLTGGCDRQVSPGAGKPAHVVRSLAMDGVSGWQVVVVVVVLAVSAGG